MKYRSLLDSLFLKEYNRSQYRHIYTLANSLEFFYNI